MSQETPPPGDETRLTVVSRTLKSGVRDFRIVRGIEPGQKPVEINPLELLALNRTADMVERVTRKDPALGWNLALARLLIPAKPRCGFVTAAKGIPEAARACCSFA